MLSQGHALYSGAGGMTPVQHFMKNASNIVPPYREGYNVADYLLEVASDPPVGVFDLSSHSHHPHGNGSDGDVTGKEAGLLQQQAGSGLPVILNGTVHQQADLRSRSSYATTFLTQFQYLCGREWKILQR